MGDTLSTIKKTTFVILGGFGFEIYGLNFLVISLFIYCLLAVLDSILGYSIARKMKTVGSKQWDSGFDRKMSQLIIMIIVVMACGSFANEIDYAPVELGLGIIAFIPIMGFSFGQITSVIENMAITAHGKELRFINILLKLAGIGQAKLEEKLEKYNIKTNSDPIQ